MPDNLYQEVGWATPNAVKAQFSSASILKDERVHYPIDFPDPIEAIRFRMEQQGLTVDDLVPVIGRKNRVYEILARKRPLTLQ